MASTTTTTTTTTTTASAADGFCDNSDLDKVRPDILLQGVTDWADQIAEATSIINRALEARWYRQAAKNAGLDPREYPYDQNLLLNSETQLTRLAVYKTLELGYLYLMKDAPDPDAFERETKVFKTMYANELAEVLGAGLDYDWDETGDIAYTEKNIPVMRRLKRC